jgi:hypothetical protein
MASGRYNPPPMSTARTVGKSLTMLVAGAAVVWLAATAAVYAAMLQPPARFGAIMSRVPGPAMMVLPFKPLWMSARAGHLRLGDAAPDFSLRPLHGDAPVTLSKEYRSKPVVLIFGSYT